mgnify:CR=1 FL=1
MGRIQGHDLHGTSAAANSAPPKICTSTEASTAVKQENHAAIPKRSGANRVRRCPICSAVVLAPGNGEFTHDKRGHGGYEQKTRGADALGQREIALLCAAVEPLEHPAFGGKGQRREQRLHEQRHTVVGKFACVGEALVACEAEIDMRP